MAGFTQGCAVGALFVIGAFCWMIRLRNGRKRYKGKPAKLSKVATIRHVAIGDKRNFIVHNGGHTFFETWNCEGDFTAIRLVYANAIGGEGFGVGGALVAATDHTIDAGVKPGPDVSDEKLVRVTFDSRGQAVAYGHQTIFAETEHVTDLPFPPLEGIPDGSSVWSPDLLLSDWMSVMSVPRRRGRRGAYLRVRTFIKPGCRLTGPTQASRNEIDPANAISITGYVYERLYSPGDFVSAEGQVGSETLSRGCIGNGAVYAVQFITRRPGITVQGVGDSILQGVGFELGSHIGGFTSFGALACSYLATPEMPVSFLQSSIGSEPSANFFQSARADLDYADVGVALIQTWSGNDINIRSSAKNSCDAADAAWESAMEYAALVRRRGGVPIFLSAVPQAPAITAIEGERARLSSVERCRKLARRGQLVLDMNDILGDGARIANYKPVYRWIDNIHPNTVAQFALAARAAELIRSAIGR